MAPRAKEGTFLPGCPWTETITLKRAPSPSDGLQPWARVVLAEGTAQVTAPQCHMASDLIDSEALHPGLLFQSLLITISLHQAEWKHGAG